MLQMLCGAARCDRQLSLVVAIAITITLGIITVVAVCSTRASAHKRGLLHKPRRARTLASSPGLKCVEECGNAVATCHVLCTVGRVQAEVGEHGVEVVGLQRSRQRREGSLELGG